MVSSLSTGSTGWLCIAQYRLHVLTEKADLKKCPRTCQIFCIFYVFCHCIYIYIYIYIFFVIVNIFSKTWRLRLKQTFATKLFGKSVNCAVCLVCDRNELDFFAIKKLRNSWNENFPVQVGRDGQVLWRMNDWCEIDISFETHFWTLVTICFCLTGLFFWSYSGFGRSTKVNFREQCT